MSDSRVIFERSVKGRMGIAIPKLDVPEISLSDSIPPELLRETPANLPEVSEPQVVRHYVNLSVKNHHIDKDFCDNKRIRLITIGKQKKLLKNITSTAELATWLLIELSRNPSIFELDYEAMRKNNQDMYEELIKEVMKPSRVFKNPNYDYIEELFGD